MRALVVSYNFPPVGGAGVQRMSKLVRYLPSHGVTPAVLTVANPSVPLRDESLEKDLPPDLEIVRARTFEPDYAVKAAAVKADASAAKPTLARRGIRALSKAAKAVLVPDPQVLWLPHAEAKLLPRLLRRADDAVLVSGPPFSQFVLAGLARVRPGVGIVLDYRDEWSTYRTSYENTSSPMARLAGDVLEPTILRLVHRVTTATEEFREELLRQYRFLSPEHVVTIPNGYDPADFPANLPEPPSDRLVLGYAGTIFRLTGARGLMGAIRRLHRDSPELGKLLEVRLLGRIVDTEREYFEGTEQLGVRTLGYVPHAEVLPALASSHVALCLLDEVPGTERIYPAKIFELMHLGRRILTLAPEGALTRLVRAHELGEVLPPRDEVAIAATLARWVRELRDTGRITPPTPKNIEQFDRRALAGRFAAVLQDAVRAAR